MGSGMYGQATVVLAPKSDTSVPLRPMSVQARHSTRAQAWSSEL